MTAWATGSRPNRSRRPSRSTRLRRSGKRTSNLLPSNLDSTSTARHSTWSVLPAPQAAAKLCAASPKGEDSRRLVLAPTCSNRRICRRVHPANPSRSADKRASPRARQAPTSSRQSSSAKQAPRAPSPPVMHPEASNASLRSARLCPRRMKLMRRCPAL